MGGGLMQLVAYGAGDFIYDSNDSNETYTWKLEQLNFQVPKNSLCPITLEPITNKTAGAPPCGHLFNKDALKKELERSGRCPTCRAAAKPTEIQTI